MGNKITFAEAVAAIVVHHANLYNLLLATLPAYSGGKTPPPRKERISHILNCEENDAHRILEELATAAKAKPRGVYASANAAFRAGSTVGAVVPTFLNSTQYCTAKRFAAQLRCRCGDGLRATGEPPVVRVRRIVRRRIAT